MTNPLNHLVRFENTLSAGGIDPVALDPKRIEAVFWAETSNHVDQPCAIISLRDGMKIYWIITRREYERFLENLSPATEPIISQPTLFDVGEN